MMKGVLTKALLACAAIAVLALADAALAQDTGVSLDVGLFGNTLGHEEVHRVARGEEIRSTTGLPVKLRRSS